MGLFFDELEQRKAIKAAGVACDKAVRQQVKLVGVEKRTRQAVAVQARKVTQEVRKESLARSKRARVMFPTGPHSQDVGMKNGGTNHAVTCHATLDDWSMAIDNANMGSSDWSTVERSRPYQTRSQWATVVEIVELDEIRKDVPATIALV